MKDNKLPSPMLELVRVIHKEYPDRISPEIVEICAKTGKVPESVTAGMTNDEYHGVLFSAMQATMDKLPSTHVVEVVAAGDGIGIAEFAAIKAEAASGDAVAFYTTAIRPGFNNAMVEIEHTLFPPRSEGNELFRSFVDRFPRTEIEGIPISVFSVPNIFEQKVQDILTRNGLRWLPTNSHVLTILGPGGEQQYPLFGDNIFYLENTPGHAVYDNSQKAVRDSISDAIIDSDYYNQVAKSKKENHKPSQK